MQRWDLVERERLALADLLEGLDDEQWDTASLCTGWRVREVVAHLMVGPTSSGREVVRAVLRHRGDVSRAMDAMARERGAAPTPELVRALRENAASRFHPPLLDWRAPLADVLVHREDVAVPLGLPQDRPTDAWALALAFLVTRTGRTAFETGALPPVRFVGTDVDWEHGSGPQVRGPASAIALALTGRSALVDRLDGDGVDVVRDRLLSTRR